MKIKEGLQVREMAGERVLILQGRMGADLTKIISLNATAEWLFNHFQGREFTVADIVNALAERFSIDPSTAQTDAARWADDMIRGGAIQA